MTAAGLALAAGLLGTAPRAAAADAPYGVLVLAYGVGGAWRKELPALRAKLRGRPVESVEGEADGLAIQRAIDRLAKQRLDKIVAVPLEPVSESAVMDKTRYLFGIRPDAVEDLPDARQQGLAGGRPTALKIPQPARRGRRLRSPVPLVLAGTLDRSTALAEILADRARALARDPKRETVALAAVAPRSDKALAAWRLSAEAAAEQVRVRGGFRKAAVLAVRDGVRSEARERDRVELRSRVRELMSEGPVVVVPLTPDPRRLDALLRRALGSAGYRWDGKGLVGDARLLDWIASAALSASALPDSRRHRDDGPAPGARLDLSGDNR